LSNCKTCSVKDSLATNIIPICCCQSTRVRATVNLYSCTKNAISIVSFPRFSICIPARREQNGRSRRSSMVPRIAAVETSSSTHVPFTIHALGSRLPCRVTPSLFQELFCLETREAHLEERMDFWIRCYSLRCHFRSCR
jgi:hypothetical protein